MTINRYAVLGVTIEDAKAHPACSSDVAIVTPRSTKEGLVLTGYVLTDAFATECTRDDARGDAARLALLTTKRNASKGTPVRTVRPATIAEAAERFGDL